MDCMNRRTRRISPKRLSAGSYFAVNQDPVCNKYPPFHPSKILFSILFSFSVTISASPNNCAKKILVSEYENNQTEVDAPSLDLYDNDAL